MRDRQRLTTACLRPGPAVAGLALMAGGNANLLHRCSIWRYEDKRNGVVAKEVAENTQAAFVPVVKVTHCGLQPLG